MECNIYTRLAVPAAFFFGRDGGKWQVADGENAKGTRSRQRASSPGPRRLLPCLFLARRRPSLLRNNVKSIMYWSRRDLIGSSWARSCHVALCDLSLHTLLMLICDDMHRWMGSIAPFLAMDHTLPICDRHFRVDRGRIHRCRFCAGSVIYRDGW